MHLHKATTLTIFAILCNLCIAAGVEPYTCRNGGFTRDQKNFELVNFNGDKDEKLYFYSDDKGCPESEANCRQKAYIVSGDELIINNRVGHWACAWFHGKKNETVGWVKSEKLENKIINTTNLEGWYGTWKFFKTPGYISIKNKGKSLTVKGETIWNGGNQNINTGEISGTTIPKNNQAIISDGDDEYSCKVNFTLLGKYLIVKDNHNCGGLNVNFDGVYTKIKK